MPRIFKQHKISGYYSQSRGFEKSEKLVQLLDKNKEMLDKIIFRIQEFNNLDEPFKP